MKFHLQTSIALEYGYFERTLLTLIFFFLLTSNLQKKESQTFSKERLEILTAQEATNLHVPQLSGKINWTYELSKVYGWVPGH